MSAEDSTDGEFDCDFDLDSRGWSCSERVQCARMCRWIKVGTTYDATGAVVRTQTVVGKCYYACQTRSVAHTQLDHSQNSPIGPNLIEIPISFKLGEVDSRSSRLMF